MWEPEPPRRRSLPAAVLGIGVTLALLVGALLVSPTSDLQTIRRLIGLGSDRAGFAVDYTPGEGSYEFLLSAPPLPITGAVGSPINPVAVL